MAIPETWKTCLAAVEPKLSIKCDDQNELFNFSTYEGYFHGGRKTSLAL